jgi:hypothetical protein
MEENCTGSPSPQRTVELEEDEEEEEEEEEKSSFSCTAISPQSWGYIVEEHGGWQDKCIWEMGGGGSLAEQQSL